MRYYVLQGKKEMRIFIFLCETWKKAETDFYFFNFIFYNVFVMLTYLLYFYLGAKAVFIFVFVSEIDSEDFA